MKRLGNQSDIYLEEAEKRVLLSLRCLSQEDSSVFYSASDISDGVPEKRDGYGCIYPKDVRELLVPYVEDGSVLKTTIRQHNRDAVGYLINLSGKRKT